jgi:hypothetical protein
LTSQHEEAAPPFAIFEGWVPQMRVVGCPTSRKQREKWGTELRRHAVFQSFKKRTDCCSIIVKRLGTVVKLNPGLAQRNA